jgi:hypothetical protein
MQAEGQLNSLRLMFSGNNKLKAHTCDLQEESNENMLGWLKKLLLHITNVFNFSFHLVTNLCT